MKNLKKVLALVLVVATLMGMATVASAAAYTDGNSIEYTEAVDVMSAAGILEGYPDGSFAPTANLTRAQAAKMVSYILNSGVDVNDLYAGANTFTDCTTSWAKGYIAYANKAGIVVGVGNNKFNPNGTLKGVDLAKMMLCALGYDAEIEGYQNNASWMVNILDDAKAAGLLDGLELVNMYNPITREEASQMMFNALTADMVGYDNKGTEIDLGNGSITIGASAAKPVTVAGNPAWANGIDTTKDAANSNNSIVQLAEQYLRDLNRMTSQTDDFNRPASVWTITKNGVANTIGVYTDTPVLTYTTEVTQDALYKDLGLDSLKYNLTVYNDGARTNAYALTGDTNTYVVKGSSAPADGTANGVLTEVFTNVVNDTTYITISQIHNYVGEVVSVTNATATKARTVTIAGYTAAAGTYETEDFAAGDIVTYTCSKKDSTPSVKSVALAEQVKGKLTSYVGETSVTLDSTSYKYSTDIKDMADGGVLNKDVTLYLDPYGYVLHIDGVVASTQYAYMLKYNANGGTYGSDKVAQLLMADGTIVDASVKDVKQGTWGSAIATGDTGIVTYTVDSNSKYTLTGVQETNASSAVTMTKGSATVTLQGTTVTADANTVVLVKTGTETDPTYTAYTGIANMPSISGNAQATAYAIEGTTAEMIFINAIGATVSTSVDQAAYLLGNPKAGLVNDADGKYYLLQGVVNGKIQDVKVDETVYSALNLGSEGGVALSNLNFNEKGIAVSYSMGNAVNGARGTTAVAHNVIGLGTGAYTYTSDCVVFYVNTDKDSLSITASTIAGLRTDASDYVDYVYDANGAVLAVFVEENVTTGAAISKIELLEDGAVEATVNTPAAGSTSSMSATGVAGAKAELKVTVAAGSENATVSVKGMPSTFPTTGSTNATVTITVASEDGKTTNNFTVNVTLTAAP